MWSRLGDVVPNLLVYLGVASVLGLGGSLLLSRRVKRQTLGMEPTEIAGLVEHREALVHGVKEGVIATRRAAAGHGGQRRARQLLGLPLDCVGRRLDDLDLDHAAGRGAHQPAARARTGWCWSATGCWPSTGGRCARTAR